MVNFLPFLLKASPMPGIFPNPGTWSNVSLMSLILIPPITNVSPLSTSALVWIELVNKAGTPPWTVWDQSGVDFSIVISKRILPSGVREGITSNLTPASINSTVGTGTSGTHLKYGIL